MALTTTFNEDRNNLFGTVPVVFSTVTTGANDYPTGGYALTGAQFGLGGIRGVSIVGQNTAAAGYVPQYNSQTGKLQVFVMPAAATAGPLVEEANNGNLNGAAWNLIVYGTAE